MRIDEALGVWALAATLVFATYGVALPVPTASASQQVSDSGQAYHQARELLGKDQPRQALDLVLLPWLDREPDDVPSTLLAGEAYFLLEEFEKARIYYEKGLKLDASYKGRVFNLGRTYLKLGLHEQALGTFTAMQAETNSALQQKGWLGTGLTRLEMGQEDQAETAFRQAIRIAPNDHRSAYQLGLLEQKRGKLEAAAQRFERVLELRPLHHGAAYNLARVYLRSKDATRAQAAQKRHKQIMDGKKRISSLRDRLAESPRDVHALGELGRTHAGLGDHREAVKWYQRALQLAGRPDHGMAFAASLRALGQNGQAERVYETLLSRTPPFREALDPLVELLRARGADERAEQWLRRFPK